MLVVCNLFVQNMYIVKSNWLQFKPIETLYDIIMINWL